MTHTPANGHNLRDLKPYQIVSLWEMVEFDIGRLYWLLNGLVAVKNDLEKRKHPTLDDREELGLRSWADAADEICANCDIDPSYYTDHIRRKVENPTRLKYTVASAVDQLRHYIVKELKDRKFLFVPAAEYGYFDHERLFGSEVEDKFPSANKEITFAGNCYATGNYTACVFHLMRAVEIGARSMVERLKVQSHLKGQPVELCDWGTLIGALQKGVDALEIGSRTDVRKKKRLEFYSHALASLRNFKNAWRNHVSHTRELYLAGQTKDIMDNTRQFMQHLAGRLKE